VEPWLQAGKYVGALVSDLPKCNGWTIAQQVGDQAPLRTQRLLGRAVWDTFAAMRVVRRFAVAGLDEAARRAGRRRGLRVGAIDETSQVKQGTATAGVKRQYLGCVGKVANGITTVHLSYVRERTGHTLIGARQWVPAEHLSDPVKSLLTGLPDDLVFRTKGQLAIDICTEALADDVRFDFLCGDEVYGNCTQLREFCKNTARDMCYGSPPASASPWRWGSRCPAPRRSPACSKTLAAGRSAPLGPARRASAGMRGRGWAPPPRGTTC
jgi:SRSO17 transposase